LAKGENFHTATYLSATRKKVPRGGRKSREGKKGNSEEKRYRKGPTQRRGQRNGLMAGFVNAINQCRKQFAKRRVWRRPKNKEKPCHSTTVELRNSGRSSGVGGGGKMVYGQWNRDEKQLKKN